MPQKNPPPTPSNPPPDPRAAAIAAHNTNRAAERAKRLVVLKKIADDRKSAVLGYVTANRGSIGAQVSTDTIRLLREHLGRLGKVEKIDLLLITHGGNTLTPLRLISLLREFAKTVGVLVPYMAHSAGTLICLGADEILMGSMGELGPVDPSVSNHFNPILEPEDTQGTPQKPRPRIPISVEDVTSYLNFARTHAKLDDTGMSEAYKALTGKVNPLALGNVLRNHYLIRHLARQLLLMHTSSDSTKIDGIVKTLTEELYSHNYVITRDEAQKIGLDIKTPSDTVEEAMWDLFKMYESHLGIDRPINMAVELGNEKQKYLCYDLAVLESESLLHSFVVRGTGIRKGQSDFEFNAESQSWEEA